MDISILLVTKNLQIPTSFFKKTDRNTGLDETAGNNYNWGNKIALVQVNTDVYIMEAEEKRSSQVFVERTLKKIFCKTIS